MVVIPANAWHKHYNADPDRPASQLAFKNTRLLRKLFHSRDFVYANDFRFHDRYDDEPDYWTSRTPRRTTARSRSTPSSRSSGKSLEPDPSAGEQVSVRAIRWAAIARSVTPWSRSA